MHGATGRLIRFMHGATRRLDLFQSINSTNLKFGVKLFSVLADFGFGVTLSKKWRFRPKSRFWRRVDPWAFWRFWAFLVIFEGGFVLKSPLFPLLRPISEAIYWAPFPVLRSKPFECGTRLLWNIQEGTKFHINRFRRYTKSSRIQRTSWRFRTVRNSI